MRENWRISSFVSPPIRSTLTSDWRRGFVAEENGGQNVAQLVAARTSGPSDQNRSRTFLLLYKTSLHPSSDSLIVRDDRDKGEITTVLLDVKIANS